MGSEKAHRHHSPASFEYVLSNVWSPGESTTGCGRSPWLPWSSSARLAVILTPRPSRASSEAVKHVRDRTVRALVLMGPPFGLVSRLEQGQSKEDDNRRTTAVAIWTALHVRSSTV